MTPEQAKLVHDLDAFVMSYLRAGKTYRQFWEAFNLAERKLAGLVKADDADPELVEAYWEIRNDAHEVFGVPEEMMDQAMED